MLDTIVSLATPPMMGAIAVIRVSGTDAFSLVSKSFTKDLTTLTKKDISYGFIKDGDEIVDEVVCISFVAPASFTGEDVVEISCHGSMLIANQIISLLIKNGARLAERGEFSSRAYINGKVDLVQAEAINDMINATTAGAKRLSLLSLTGETSKIVHPLKQKIGDVLSLIEVNIDYPEYKDIDEANYEMVIKAVDEINEVIGRLIKEGKQGQLIKEGIKIAIVGAPNVGKSSLLNRLLKEEKAIVTDIAGTTRDVVEGEIILKGLKFILLDTAGIRESGDYIENIGIKKSIEQINKADFVVYVKDAQNDGIDSELEKHLTNKEVIVIYNKSDKVSNKQQDKIYISALNDDIEALKNELIKRVGIDNDSFSRPSLNNARQIALLARASEQLNIAKQEALGEISIDLVSVSLQQAFFTIQEILGENVDNDLSKEIFSRFCVGK